MQLRRRTLRTLWRHGGVNRSTFAARTILSDDRRRGLRVKKRSRNASLDEQPMHAET